MRTLDRYLLRQVFWPFTLGLVVFTFILIVPELMRYAEEYISKGVSLVVFARLVIALLPFSLALTIPMSLLLGLLIAFGRLSVDREFVALQACGVSLHRLLRPVTVLATAGALATAYVYMVLIPVGNQTFREITFNILAASAEGQVKPRVFFDEFPGIVLYARELPATGGWDGVFLADDRSERGTTVYVARRGRVIVNRAQQTVELLLENGALHASSATDAYTVQRFDSQLLALNPGSMFPGQPPPKGDREMTLGELWARVAEFEAAGRPTDNQFFEIHKRFSIPFACFVFGLIGVVVGVSNRRGSRLASFVVGLVVIFAYYVLLWFGQSLVEGQLVYPWLAAWGPNLTLGAAGILLFRLRHRIADRPILVIPEALATRAPRRRRALGRSALPFGILDRYVAVTYARVLTLAATALCGIFYVSTFLDLSDEVFQGAATWAMLGSYLAYATPQFVYYIIPLSVLLATLVTIALLTRNSELVVMKACGISLYRVALPLVLGAVLAGSTLFALEQTILGPSNRRAEAVRHVMMGGSPETFDVLTRRWVVGQAGTIYHFNYFDPDARRFTGLSVYEFDTDLQRLTRRTYADVASFAGGDEWRVNGGWVREFDQAGEPVGFEPFAELARRLDPPSVFSTAPPDPAFMSFTELRDYTEQLAQSGFDVVRQRVALWRKASFPFVALVMALIAVPFAVTIGRGGAMAGIGVGIAIALVYWTVIILFAAMGSGGLVSPTLAAWAPNLLFAAGALYLLLTVRT